MSILLKCPNNHQNPLPFGRVTCEFCKKFGIPVDIGVDKNLIISEYNSLYEKLETSLQRLKTLPEPSVAKLFYSRLINIVTIGLFSVFTKNKTNENSYNSIESDVVKNKKLLENKFGEEEKVKELIKDVSIQLNSIRNNYRKKQTIASILSFNLIVILTVFALLIFASPFPETEEYFTENEKISLINKQIQNKISEGKYHEAKQIANKLNLVEKTKALRNIQIAYLDSELQKVGELINARKLSDAEIYLSKLNWNPIENPRFDTRERELISVFEKKKQALHVIILKDK